MVLAERNTGDIVRNGRRSRGPSPNTHTSGAGSGAAGHAHNAASGLGGGAGNHATNATGNEKAAAAVPGAGTPESSDDDNSTKRNGKSKAKQSEYEEKIRVGRDYQAVCPQLVPEMDRRPELMNERALLVWSPTKEIPDTKLEEYISVAKDKYGYNGEQALGMLFWHKHDLERAVMDLANFTPFPDEWTLEDKVLFDQAFQFHGKSFHRIRQMLPDKSIASLVKYYYSWKKTRHRSSAMDRQEKMIKAAVKDGSENGSEVGSNEESDNDNDKRANNNNSTMNNNNSGMPGCNGNGNAMGDSNSNNGGNGSNSNSNINTNIKESDLDQLCVYPNALGNDILGFGSSGLGLAINNSGEVDADSHNSSSNNNSGTGKSGNTGSSNGNAARRVVGGFCKNCNVVCYILFDSPLGRMCESCHMHWRRTGNRRPISGPDSIASAKRSTQNNNNNNNSNSNSNNNNSNSNNNSAAAAADRAKRKPPRGMYINHDDLTALASCKNPCEYLTEGDRKIAALMAEIQKNRQLMEQLEKECAVANDQDEGSSSHSAKAASNAAAESTQTTTTTTSASAATSGASAVGASTATTAAASPAAASQPARISARWTNDEIKVVMLGLREYGKNFAMIAKVVGTKTEAHVRTYYLSNRRRLNLDDIIKEHDAKAEDAEEQGTETAPAAGSATSAATAPAAAAAGSVSSSTSSSEPSQEQLAKKEDSGTTRKKSELLATGANASIESSSSSSSAAVPAPLAATLGGAANTTATATASSSTAGGTKTTATITIVDESDTATSSSSDAVNSNSVLPAAASNSLSDNSNTINNNNNTTNNSSNSNSTPTKLLTNHNHNEDAELSPTFKSSQKRENSDLNTAEMPPAKKIALAVGAEFLAK